MLDTVSGRPLWIREGNEIMGMFVNNVELIGNLGRDPEIRHTASGKKIATLNIATSESWKDTQSGEWRERTEWHRVVVFSEGLATIAEKHLEKGMKVRVEGKLRTRKWEDQPARIDTARRSTWRTTPVRSTLIRSAPARRSNERAADRIRACRAGSDIPF